MSNVMRTVSLLASLLLVALHGVRSSAGAEADDLAKPRCALVTADRSPVVSLLEAKLLTRESETWLERSEIDRILAEQELQAAFGAKEGAFRTTLGRLLMADVLILLRSGEKSTQPYIELVVAETAGGLRLLARSIALSDDVDADVVRIEQLVNKALTRNREPIRVVFAVPPFVSRNLSYRLDYLQGAYAKFVENTLLSMPGVVVVELEEAQAIAKERDIREPRRALERPEPIILFGEFRHEPQETPTQVSFRLTLRRGHDVLVEWSKSVDAKYTGNYLQGIGLRALDLSLDAPVQRSSDESDAEQLASRAADFLRIGQWQEAAELSEAALLATEDRDTPLEKLRPAANVILPGRQNLPPEPSPTRYQERLRQAVIAYGGLTGEFFLGRVEPGDRIRGIDYYLRGLEHLEEFIRVTGELHVYSRSQWGAFIREFLSSCAGLEPNGPRTEVHAYADQAKKREYETLIRIIRMRVERGFKDDAVFVPWAYQHLSTQEHFDLAYRLLCEFCEQPGFEARYRTYACGRYSISVLGSPEAEAFLGRLEESGNAKLKAAARRLRQYRERVLTDRRAQVPKRVVTPTLPSESQPIKFNRVDLNLLAGNDKTEEFNDFAGCIPAGPATDVVWGSRCVYLMRKPGMLQLAWRGPYNIGLGEFVYDGRYAWSSYWSPGQLGLMVLDPETGSVREFGESDGVPADWINSPAKSHQVMRIAPLGPGRACLATRINARCSVTLADIQTGELILEPVHEARYLSASSENLKWTDTELVCNMDVHTVSDGSLSNPEANRCVVIERNGSAIYGLFRYPMLYNPNTCEMTILKLPIDNLLSSDCVGLPDDHSLFCLGYVTRTESIDLIRIGFPDLVPQRVMTALRPGYLIYLNGQPYVLGRRCWRVNVEQGTVEDVGDVPWYFEGPGVSLVKYATQDEPHPDAQCVGRTKRAMFRSSQYGVLAKTRSANGKTVLFQIKADDPHDK